MSTDGDGSPLLRGSSQLQIRSREKCVPTDSSTQDNPNCTPGRRQRTASLVRCVTSPKLLPGWKHSFANHHAWVPYHPPPSPRIRHAYAWLLSDQAEVISPDRK